MSLKDLIVEYLKSKYPEIIHKGKLGKIAVNSWGYEGDTLGRECRNLKKKGIIERFEDDKGCAMYQYIPEKLDKLRFAEATGGRRVSEKDKLKYL